MAEQVGHSRANAENDIYDVNLYLFNPQYNTMQNHYLTAGNSSLTLELVNGTYELYAIANRGGNLGTMSRAALENLKSTVEGEAEITTNGRMVMSCRQSVTVSCDAALRIPLERLAAKVNFNISLSGPMAADSKIVHIQAYSCNNSVDLFGESRIVSVSGSIGSYPLYDVSASNLKTLSKSYYFMENKQGRNSAVTAQSGRTKANAPIFSTYLLIRIERNTKHIDYRIYLGENMTDDFNLCRNTNYTYNVVIAGENINDLRVSTTNIYIRKGMPSVGQQINSFNQFLFGSPYRFGYCELHIETANNEPDNAYFVSFYAVSGTFIPNWYLQYMDTDVIPKEYKPIAQNQRISMHSGNGKSLIALCFFNEVTTVYNHVFNFSIQDKYGYAKNITVTTSKTWD